MNSASNTPYRPTDGAEVAGGRIDDDMIMRRGGVYRWLASVTAARRRTAGRQRLKWERGHSTLRP
eukprot:CAMPEP_0119543622 /NCGR_PEP_ID=MMETSP1344-20130328/54231_1 /TAXON_ID=236787 /ORGANISM="Florenciella parvula, Strain CCMP2471" /LENGTH=64 /DNA_ID=CAMNT_0007587947 /DNA_START=60 /DNA_END=251 /DNA_ORIENTATION=+